MHYFVKELNLTGVDVIVKKFTDKKKAMAFAKKHKNYYISTVDPATKKPNDDIRRLGEDLVA